MNITRSIITLAISVFVFAHNADARQAIGAINPDGDPEPAAESPSSFTIDPSKTSTTPSGGDFTITPSTGSTPVSPGDDFVTGSTEPPTVSATDTNPIGVRVDDDDDDDDDRGGRRNSGDRNTNTTTVDDNGCLENFGCDIQDPEYENHEDAITKARRVADSECSSSCSGLDRVEIINEVYFRELQQSGSTLPSGPMESMVYFADETANTSLDNNVPSAINEMSDIDEGVRRGDYGAVMPAQFSIAYPDAYSEMNATQRLGTEKAAIITNADSFLDANVGSAAGAAVQSFGGPGGTIILRNGYDSVETVRHEANHAGELAVLNIIDSTSHNDYENESQRDNAYEAASVVYNNRFVDDISAICASCESTFSSINEEVVESLISYREVRAYLSEADSLSGFQSNLVNGLRMSPTNASRVANELSSSSIINEQINSINAAAQTIMDLNL